VLEDVIDGYVTVGRAAKDYGVVIREIDPEILEYEVDEEATDHERATIRAARIEWLAEDPETVASQYRAGELNEFDAIRRHGVILHWGTGELLPASTETYRQMMLRRSAAHWDIVASEEPVL
jgi:N-methylhydantoinase B